MSSKKHSAMVFKIDFAKAYDSIRWDYLGDVLKSFGFGVKWCSWIRGILNSSMASILDNGSPTKVFQFHRGLKQGDPLAPYLFIINIESLHLSFSRVIKAGIFTGENMSSIRAWDETVNKLKLRLSSWKLKTLSIGGLLTLLKSVLRSTPIYNMSLFKVPKAVLKSMESIRRNFFNGIRDGEKKIAWVSWSKVLASKSDSCLQLSYPRRFTLKNNKVCTVAAKMSAPFVSSLYRAIRGGEESAQLSRISDLLDIVVLSNMGDRQFWDLKGDGCFRVKDVRRMLDDMLLSKSDVSSRWVKQIPIKVNVLAWKISMDRLPTREDETIDTFTEKLTTLVNKAASLGHTMEDETLVRKLLNALPDRGRGRGDHRFSQERNHKNLKEEKKDGETSHKNYNRNNFKKSNYDTSKLQCYKCKKKGHIAPKCPQRTKPNEQSNVIEEDLKPTLLMAILKDEEQKVSLHEEDVGYKETNMDSLWYLDNGASNHLTGVRKHFKELDEKVSGKQRIISHVYYIPDLKSNLLSLGKFTKIGCKVVMEDDELRLYDMDNKIFMKVTRQRNRLYKETLRIENMTKDSGDTSKKKVGITNTPKFQCPMLKPSNYSIWAIRMQIILEANGLWEMIEPKGKTQADNKKDKTAMAFLYQALPEEQLLQITKHKTAKAIWDALKTRHIGEERVQQARLQTLKSNFEMLHMKEDEAIDTFTTKLRTLVNKAASLGHTMKDEELVRKLLNAIPDRYLQIVASIEQYSDLDEMTLEEAIGILKTYERIKYKKGKQVDNQEKLMFTRHENKRRYSRGRGRGRYKLSQGRNRKNFKEERKEGETSHKNHNNNSKKSNFDTSKLTCYK
nr:zinc finger, CCHC-type [Tanacetum cinerariifolium]